VTSEEGIRIGELMKRTGVTRATIHHYVREGLLPEPVKTGRNMALYKADCVDRVLLIKSLQSDYRRSLAEVRDLLSKAEGHRGLARLRAQVGTLLPAESALLGGSDPSTLEALAERTGFALAEVEEFAAHGLIAIQRQDGERVLKDHDVAVVEALAKLREAGFRREDGFQAEDVAIYLTAQQALLREELKIFLKRAKPGDKPEDLVALAELGVQNVTPLLLAFRQKVIRELIDTLPLAGPS